MKKQLWLASAASVVTVAMPSGAAYAQGIEEIVVTATKREENLQDVPISVATTTGETINELAITKPEDLSSVLPAVTIAQNPIGNFIFIRGIGTPGANQGIEQSVSMFRDGVYAGRHQLTRAPFLDVARVEVLRGPQSILFGKNTVGGAVSIIDNEPTDEFEARVSALYGSFNEREFTAVVNGRVTENADMRIAFRKYDTDGYLKNIVTGEDGPERDDWTLRGSMKIELSPDIDVLFKYEHSVFDQGQQSTQLAIINPYTAGAAGVAGLNQALVAAASGGTGVEQYDRERAVDNDGGVLLGQVAPVFRGLPGFPDKDEVSKNKMDLASMRVNWGFGEHTLTSITGFAGYSYRDICDCDFSALPLIEADAREKYSQFSQELRLTSPTGGTIEYILGAFYQNADLEFNSRETFGSALAFQQVGVPTPLLVPNLTREYTFDQKQKQYALFGQLTWNISDRTRLTGGLRWLNDKKTASHNLDKSFSAGWNYTGIVPAGAPAVFGDTAAEYDRFLSIYGGAAPGVITEAVYSNLLGTHEHDIRNRKNKESGFNFNVNAQYDVADDVMVYGTVATGTKGGGFDARFLGLSNGTVPGKGTQDFFEYAPEKATSYELGFKSQFAGNTVRLNMAAFLIDVKDFQVSIFDGATAFLVDNAAKLRSKGIEAELTWAPIDGLTISAAGSYLDARYRDFVNAPCWATPAPPNDRGDCIGLGTPTAHRDASGERINFAPKFSGTFGASYWTEISESMKITFGTNIAYTDGFFSAADLDPIIAYQKRNTKIDLRVALGHVDDKWEVAFLGKNLTNELTSYNNNDQPLVPGNGFALTSPPRSYAVQASYKF